MAKKRNKYEDEDLGGLVLESANNFGAQVEQVAEQIEAEVKEAATQGRLQWVDIELINPNPNQPPGRVVEDEDLRTLAQDMRENGFLEEYAIPARAMKGKPGQWEQVTGHRRLAAAILADKKQVPIFVRDYTDLEMLWLNFKENEFRKQLNPLDLAFSYGRMLAVKDEKTGIPLYTQVSVAKTVGKSRGHVRNHLDLLLLPNDLKAMVRANPETIRAAQYLLDQEEALRTDAIALILQGDPDTGEHLTGELVPGYIRAWKEKMTQARQEEADRQAQALLPSIEETAFENMTQTEHETQEETPKERRSTLQAVPAPTPTTRTLPDKKEILQTSKVESAEILAISDLQNIEKKLRKYIERRGERTPGTTELFYLREIEKLAVRARPEEA